MPNYIVYVTQRNVFHIEADNPDQASDRSAANYRWGPDQQSPEYSDCWVDVEEDNDD